MDRTVVTRAGEFLLDAVFPPVCMLCETLLRPGRGGDVCAACRESLEAVRPPYCSRCGRPFEEGEPARLCGNCAVSEPDFDMLRAPYVYADPLRTALIRFKFRRVSRNTRPLAALLGAVAGLGVDWRDYDVAVPVPLHAARLRKRGFNQAQILARHLLQGTRLRLDAALLDRVRETVPQVGLSHAARRENVRGAFAVREGADIQGKKILLVDDIATTGATCSEAARVLKKAGAARVDAVTVARSLGFGAKL
ncbi:MAG: ComF family protein [Deltaproteobacteria bacterium]|nr:ComF family protein [Deltaproteobacteria bacterium]